MAFILTPRFAPAYQAPQCNPFGCYVSATRPTYTYQVSRPQPRRPQYSSFSHFFNQIDELLGEVDRKAQRQAQLEAQIEAQVEAQREAYRQRQQRKPAPSADFAVNQNGHGWEIHGDLSGYDQKNISIEVTDEHTLKICGNTKWNSETQHPAEDASALKQSTEAVQNNVDGSTLNETEAEAATEPETTNLRAATPDSDTESRRSYQPTVEDDFEDLGAETSSLISASSGTSTPAESKEPKEPKGKEPAAAEPVATTSLAAPQPRPEAQGPQQEENVHGSFERTFRFQERIQADNISASFRDGSLKVTVPKAQVVPVRKIAIL